MSDPKNTNPDQDEALDDADQPIDLLAQLRQKAAPAELSDGVERKIEQRSGGRFFGRQSLADRRSMAVLAGLILVVAALLLWLLRDSSTGSIPTNEPEKPELAPGAEEAVPTP